MSVDLMAQAAAHVEAVTAALRRAQAAELEAQAARSELERLLPGGHVDTPARGNGVNGKVRYRRRRELPRTRRACPECGEEFDASSRQTYGSSRCRTAANVAKHQCPLTT